MSGRDAESVFIFLLSSQCFFFALRLLNELMIFEGFFFSEDPPMFFFKTLLKAVDKKQSAGQLDPESRRSQGRNTATLKRAVNKVGNKVNGRWFLLKTRQATDAMSCLIIVVEMELEKLQQLWTLHQVLVPVDRLTSECSPPPNWNL